jgi:transposase
MANTVVSIVAIQRIEVITGGGGRRFYTAEEKIRLVHEAGGGRGSVAAVARRHAICTSLIYRQCRSVKGVHAIAVPPAVSRSFCSSTA